MTKKILLAVLLAGAAIAAVFIALTMWRAGGMSVDTYLASGKKYFEEKKYAEAGIQLLNAVESDGTNRDARYYLAQTHLATGNANSAERHLTALLEHHPDDAEANVMLGNLYLAAGAQDQRYLRDAAGIAEKLLATEPDNVPALLLAGNVAAAMRDFPGAVRRFNRIIELDARNVSALVNLGSIRVLQKRFPDAEESFLKAREVDPNDKNAILSLANLYRASNDLAKAEALLNEASSRLPDDPAIYTAVVQLYYQTGRFEMAIALLKERIAKDPKNPQPYFVLSDLYDSRNMPQEARNTLKEAKKALPDSPDVAIRLAANLLPDDRSQARLEVEQVLKTAPEHPLANLLLGELQFAAGEFDDAEATLAKDVVVNSRSPEASFFLGNLALRRGELDRAVENFQRAVSLNPQYLAARVALGEVLLNKGNITAARTEADNALTLQRNYVPARLLKAAVDRAQNNFASAEAELSALVKVAPNSPLVYQQMAINHSARGRLGEAEKNYLRVLDLEPGSANALQGLVEVYVRGKETDKALRILQAIPEDQRKALHYELLGSVYEGAGRNVEAQTAFKKAIEKEPSRTGADALLARHYISTGRVAEGLAQLDELAKRVPTAAAAYGAKGLLYQSENNLLQAKTSYEEALRADPNYEPAANNLAYLLAEEGTDLNRALRLAQMARAKRPESAAIADTLGWVHHKIGSQPLAREQLLFATSRDPENPVLQYHLGMIYRANKQNLEAAAALKKALASKRNFKERPRAQAVLEEIEDEK